MNNLEELKFSLKKKKEKLKDYNTNIFTLNLEMQSLATEIFELEQKIKKVEEENNDRE